MDCLDCLECPICYDAINASSGIATLSCSHSYHISCITGWFAKLEKGTCPCCRKEMSTLEHLPEALEDDEDDEDDEIELERDELDRLLRTRGGQGLTDEMSTAICPEFASFISSELNAFLIGNGARPLNEEEWIQLYNLQYEDYESTVRWSLQKDGMWVKNIINPEELTDVVAILPSFISNIDRVTSYAATKMQKVWRTFKGRHAIV